MFCSLLTTPENSTGFVPADKYLWIFGQPILSKQGNMTNEVKNDLLSKQFTLYNAAEA